MPLSKEQELQLSTAREIVSYQSSLLKHKGWKQLSDVYKAQIRTRRTASFGKRITSLEDCFDATAVSGETAGLLLACAMPESLIDDANAEIQRLFEEEELENENA